MDRSAGITRGGTAGVAEYLTAVVGHPISAHQVADDIWGALELVDDALWSERTASDFGLARLELEALSAGQDVSVRLNVYGLDDPLYDPRVPQLIVAVRRYRLVDAVALYSADHGWRLVVATGKPATFLADLNQDHLDSMPLAADTVERLGAAHGVIADLFGACAQVA